MEKRHGILYLRAVAASLLLTIAMALGTSGFSLFVLPVTTAEGYARAQFTLCSTLISLPGALISPLLGNALHVLGPRRMVGIGCVWGTLAFAAFSLAGGLPVLYLCSVLLGMVLLPCTSLLSTVVVNSWFVRRRALVVGIVSCGSGISGAVTGLILPPLITLHGWRFGFRLLAGAWLVLTGLALLLLPGLPEQRGVQPFGGAPAGQPETVSSPDVPLPSKRILVRRAEFWLLCGAAFSLSIVNGVYQHIQAFLADGGLDVDLAGQAVGWFSISLIVCKLVLGSLLERTGLYRGLAIPASLYALAFVLLLWGQAKGMLAGVLLLAMGSAAVSMAPTLAAGQVYDQQEFKAIWGVISLMGTLGHSVGIPLWGAVYDTFGNYHPGCWAACGLILISWSLYRLALRRTKHP